MTLLALGAGEIFLLLFVLLFIFWFLNKGKGKKDNTAIQIFLSQARTSKPQREKEIRQYLSQMGQFGDALDTMTKSMLKKEMKFLQHFADLYQNRDEAAVAQFYEDAQAALGLYWKFAVAADASKGEGQGTNGTEDNSAELERLKEENERLSEELRVTMDTTARMLNEYSTMFVNSDEDASEQAESAPGSLDEDLGVEDPESVPETESELEPDAEPEPEAVSEPEVESEPEPEPEPESEPEPEPEAEPETEPEPGSEPEPESQAEPEPEPEAEPESEPEPEAKPEPEESVSDKGDEVDLMDDADIDALFDQDGSK